MPVTLGAPREHSFDEPLGLLSDCHRRIEKFLRILQKVLDLAAGQPLNEEQRRAVEAALTYFKTAAPQHTQDEEESLFPRLRAAGSPQVAAALETLAALEHDHQTADVQHARVDAWYRRWMSDGPLPKAEEQALRETLVEITEMYGRHIAVEDHEIFPRAGQALAADDRGKVGAEMARRRERPPPR